MSTEDTKDKIQIQIPGNHRFEYDPEADVTFVFLTNNGALILAKKSKLASKSEVFQSQFISDKENDVKSITDISFLTFNCMIRHIYGKEITVDKDNFLEILYASRKYAVNDLTYEAIKCALKIINACNLFEYFSEIEKYEIGALNDRIRELCVQYPLIIVSTLQLTSEVHMRVLKIILDSWKLDCTEVLLYKEIAQMIENTKGDLSWEEAKKMFGKLIYLIRFPTMTTSEIISCGKTPSLLTPSQVFGFLLWKHESTLTTWPEILLFSTQPRIFTRNALKPLNASFNWCLNASSKVNAKDKIENKADTKTRMNGKAMTDLFAFGTMSTVLPIKNENPNLTTKTVESEKPISIPVAVKTPSPSSSPSPRSK